MDLARLAVVATKPLRAVLYWRHCFVPADPASQDPLWVSADSGRWQTPEGTLYMADSETTMWCEYLRSTASQVQRADPTGGLALGGPEDIGALAREPLVEMPPRGVWTAKVRLDRVADLSAPNSQRALRAAGLHTATLLHDDFGPCPDIAALHAQLGWQALVSWSAALPERRSIAVFKPHFPRLAQFEPRAGLARPTVLHAALTRYRSGERPTWLPSSEALQA
jgi:hypothetical protein